METKSLELLLVWQDHENAQTYVISHDETTIITFRRFLHAAVNNFRDTRCCQEVNQLLFEAIPDLSVDLGITKILQVVLKIHPFAHQGIAPKVSVSGNL
jgi:hypothetical protein